MEIKSSELKKGKKLRKVFYRGKVKYYAEILIKKVYTYQIAHSRDLRKCGTKSD